MMKKILFLIFGVLTLYSCQDKINLDQLEGSNVLVAYSFPSGDTTRVYVSSSLPVKGNALALDSVNVECLVNGNRQKVLFHNKTGIGNRVQFEYYFVRHLIKGDRVDVFVDANRFPSIHATSTVPEFPIIKDIKIGDHLTNGNNCDRIALTIGNDANTDNFYAIRVIGMEGSYDGELDSIIMRNEVENIETSSEPVLNNYSLGQLSFDETNHFVDKFYIFDSSSFSDCSSYCLNLDVKPDGYVKAYRVELFKLTPEMYNFFKSVNDGLNNKVADYGLSFVTPSYTNVYNGLGVVGCYQMIRSNWIQKNN
ncbi:MAG: DUF4249 domain-containing protein [Prevotella sp.]|uniref:DUF4249 domain-containing protein n=1 Tax=Prevotella sp. TaxID=59823 RepID=UPI002588F952|nr:DUF4249 domain-containing protein [Prevotella sp.]MDD6854099.1 DUF4249 domain-containing protein [Prevotella sp.]